MLSSFSACELIAEYGSPLYVYEAAKLRADVTHITQAIAYPRTRFHFASVVNGNLALLQIFRACGWGLHANTPGDVFLGLRAGFRPDEIVYSGGNLTGAEMRELLAQGIATINLDSLSQLELLCELLENVSATETTEKRIEQGAASVPFRDFCGLSKTSLPRIGLRLNLPQITGISRTGVSVDELREAVQIAAHAGLKISGIHFYRGTGTNATEAFTASIAAVLAIGKTLPDWEYLDFGGGFGYQYRSEQAGFEWEAFGAELTRQLSALAHPPELLIEPGRAAIAGSGTLLVTVVSVKWQGDKQIVGVDSSVANIAVLSVHGGHREICALTHHTDELFLTDVCGNTTFSRDYLGRSCQLPKLQPGDVLALLDVGAYGYAMASHFLHRPRPAEVLLEDNSHRLIRRRESYEILIEQQVLSATVTG